MEFGVHLPQIAWHDEESPRLDRLIDLATAAERLGFGSITANDHLVYGRRRPAGRDGARGPHVENWRRAPFQG
jgi:alkanesulfonate monooxygenase SsuD/methylene tetrahydromethanopterin reductase-like flavin-dependent oxidoreductase (luciferase family)